MKKKELKRVCQVCLFVNTFPFNLSSSCRLIALIACLAFLSFLIASQSGFDKLLHHLHLIHILHADIFLIYIHPESSDHAITFESQERITHHSSRNLTTNFTSIEFWNNAVEVINRPINKPLDLQQKHPSPTFSINDSKLVFKCLHKFIFEKNTPIKIVSCSLFVFPLLFNSLLCFFPISKNVIY